VKIYKITDKEFKEYGCVLEGYDYSEIFERLKKVEIPQKGITYVASVDALEECEDAKKMGARGFGGYPVQLGYVCGINSEMNCLEYHKSSEFNIAMDDIILILGKVQDISDGVFDSGLCKAFCVPAGVGVELYATTLHYAPFNVNKEGYRVICVLPKGTNEQKKELEIKTDEDKMCFGVNKWLMAHKDAPDVSDGAYIGITDKNIKFDDLER
jgi:hypothetical protein